MPRPRKEHEFMDGVEHKHCSRCNRWLLLIEFGFYGAAWDELYPWCRTCVNKNERKIYADIRESRLATKHGISLEEYDVLVKAQNGICAICHQPETRRSLDVDHDHATGEIRGLLCTRCNRLLGYAKDSAAILSSAIDYLETSTVNTSKVKDL